MSKLDKKPAQEEEGGESAPLWIISFADMISLLMAFFVMLSTFNAYDKDEKLKAEAAIEATVVSLGGCMKKAPTNSLSPSRLDDGQSEGSSKPTLEKPKKSSSLNKTSEKDFRDYNVFLISTDKLFFSSGTTFTPEGKKWLDTLASYLPNIAGTCVISGQGPQSDELSVRRALSVTDYLVSSGISPKRMNISSRGTLPRRCFQQEPMLEICFVEESIE